MVCRLATEEGPSKLPLAFILVRRRRCFTPESRWKCPGGRKPLVLHPIIEDSKEHETRVETGVGSWSWSLNGLGAEVAEQAEKEGHGQARTCHYYTTNLNLSSYHPFKPT